MTAKTRQATMQRATLDAGEMLASLARVLADIGQRYSFTLLARRALDNNPWVEAEPAHSVSDSTESGANGATAYVFEVVGYEAQITLTIDNETPAGVAPHFGLSLVWSSPCEVNERHAYDNPTCS